MLQITSLTIHIFTEDCRYLMADSDNILHPPTRQAGRCMWVNGNKMEIPVASTDNITVFLFQNVTASLVRIQHKIKQFIHPVIYLDQNKTSVLIPYVFKIYLVHLLSIWYLQYLLCEFIADMKCLHLPTTDIQISRMESNLMLLIF